MTGIELQGKILPPRDVSVHVHQARDDPLVMGINHLGVLWHHEVRGSPDLLDAIAFDDDQAVGDLVAGVDIDESSPLDDHCWHALSALLGG
jgi:hypothetical protein